MTNCRNFAPAAISVILLLPLGLSACAGNTTSIQLSSTNPPTTFQPLGILQYIPPSYYACTETTPENLCLAYFSHYFNIANAEMLFNNQVFVFKNIVITDSAIKYAADDYIRIDTCLQCYFLHSGSLKQLKSGDKVDVVGVDAGASRDYAGCLVFKGCVFLPASSVQLPAAGSSQLVVTGY
jgi:hypothetical protein